MKKIYFLLISIFSVWAAELGTNSSLPFLSYLFSYESCCVDEDSCRFLGDGKCDLHLNTKSCAWDKGDCGFCNSGCYYPVTQLSSCKSEDCLAFHHPNRKLSSNVCSDGQILLNNKCMNCPEDTYSIQYFNPKTCFECTKNMECKNNTLKPKTGVYRFSHDEDLQKVFRECLEKSACGEAELEDSIYGTSCTKGYKGIMCNSCTSHYTKTSINTCSECPENIVNILITIAIIIFVGIIVYYLITTTLNVCFDSQKFHSVGLKMFVNYFQVIYLCLQYRIQWPSGVSNIMSNNGDSKQSANSLKYYYFSMKCLIDPNIEEDDLFYYRIYFMVSLPLIGLLFSSICILFMAIFYKKHKKLKHYKIITIIVPYLLIYPYVLSYSLSPIACESLEINKPENFEELKKGHTYPIYLIENRNIDCSTNDHRIKSYPVTLIGVILWGILIPFIIFILVYINRKNLHQHKFKYRYGFLITGYLRKRFYWEFVILSKKFVLVILTIIMQSGYSPSFQSILLVASLIIYLILHVYFRPYVTEELNHLEFISSLTSIITILAGIVYNESSNSNTTVSAISAIIIFVVNLYFLYIWGRFMFWKNICELLDRFKFLKKFFVYHDGFDPNISKEFERVNYMYTEELQTVYTQIKDNDINEVMTDFNKTTVELMKDIVKTTLQQYNEGQAPVYREIKKKKSIFIKE